MNASTAALVLVARLLLMAPSGTETLSEHRARIPPGGTGLLRETVQVPGLPGDMYLYLTPLPGVPPDPEADSPPRMSVRLRAELWSEAGGARSGRPPDEVNLEEIPLNAGRSALVQIAEDPASGSRLMLSLAAAGSAEPATFRPPGILEEAPRPIWIRLEAWRDRGGVREPLERNILRTLEGREVAREFILKRPVPGPPGKPPGFVEEGFRFSIRPETLSDGWLTVHARLEARALPSLEDRETVELASETSRTVAVGTPFTLSLEIPRPPGAENPESGDRRNGEEEAIVMEITPFTPSEPGR